MFDLRRSSLCPSRVEWLERRATYMEFTQVMEASKKSVSQALARAGRRKGGCTTAGLREELGLQ